MASAMLQTRNLSLSLVGKNRATTTTTTTTTTSTTTTTTTITAILSLSLSLSLARSLARSHLGVYKKREGDDGQTDKQIDRQTKKERATDSVLLFCF